MMALFALVLLARACAPRQGMERYDKRRLDDTGTGSMHDPGTPVERRGRSRSQFEIEDSQGPISDPDRNRTRAVVCVLLWYAFSISLSVYNKWMFSGRLKFPIITTSLHQLVQTFLSIMAVQILGISHRLVENTSSATDYIRRVGITSLASAADIGLGNSSLIIVTLSFYTMVKSSALGFVLLFSVLFRLEQPSWRLAGIIGVLTTGVTMMASSETQFNLVGFLLVLGASCASGLRWALVKLLLLGGSAKDHEQKPHPVQTILAISPGMFVVLLVWGMALEGPLQFAHADMWSECGIALGILLTLIPGFLAFCMTWSEFELLNVTGPLTLAIAGICKEVATIIVSVLFFHDVLSVVNIVGLCVTVVAIGLYNHYRHVPSAPTPDA